MPLKLIPPRAGKTPNYYIRGTYLGCYVDESAGTPVEATAKRLLATRKRDIERGRLEPELDQKAPEKTFLEAALDYLDAGGDDRYMGKFDDETGEWSKGVISYLGTKTLSEVTQSEIDKGAVALYPQGSAATRNRHFYTPVSAVLKHAGIEFTVKRPKGWRGTKRVDWLKPEQAFRLFAAAEKKDAEFAVLLKFLCYTGARLNEALSLSCDALALSEAFGYLSKTKNDDPRALHLPPFLVAALANHPRGVDRLGQTVFRFRKCGRLYTFLSEVKAKAGPDVAFATFHTFRHTWATWMRRYGKLDTRGLVGTGAWRDQQSAARYEHVVVSEEAQRADLLPTPQRSRKAKSVENPWTGGKRAAK